jgi:hypothetical protein
MAPQYPPTPNQEQLSSGDVYYELGPNYSNQERLVTQALMTATIPGSVIQATVRPPLPQIDPFPPRYGYPTYQERQMEIGEVFSVDRYLPNNRYALSGGVAGAQAAARNVGVADVW